MIRFIPWWLSGKESACSAGDPGSIPGREDPLEKGMVTHSSILAWRIPWIGEPDRLQSMGSQRVEDTTGQLTLFTDNICTFRYKKIMCGCFSFSGVAAYVGWQSSWILKSLPQQGLSDAEEFVIVKALNALTCMCQLGLLQKPHVYEFASDMGKFLLLKIRMGNWGSGKRNLGFPGGSHGKESACSAGGLSPITGLGRSPGKGNDCSWLIALWNF